jgi:hypothetical protein
VVTVPLEKARSTAAGIDDTAAIYRSAVALLWCTGRQTRLVRVPSLLYLY